VKINLTRENFSTTIYYDVESPLTPKHCVKRFRSAGRKHHFKKLFIAGTMILNLKEFCLALISTTTEKT
jgi:hypothetical protein